MTNRGQGERSDAGWEREDIGLWLGPTPEGNIETMRAAGNTHWSQPSV
jgi:hypothetical protein